MSYRNRPTRDAIDKILERLGLEIARSFKEQGLSQAEAATRLAGLMLELAARWDRAGDRERWLLDAVNGTPPRLSTSPKEPEHE
jgi:transposase